LRRNLDEDEERWQIIEINFYSILRKQTKMDKIQN
jgi:hypothetical protein